jgi:predicted DNA-binding protein (MmcQ/YjbR family)
VPSFAALRKAESAIQKYALGFPGAYEEFPWGEWVAKVNKKIFVFANIHQGIFRFTVKLPITGKSALALPFCAPTGYGLGKSGWVTAAFEAGDGIPLDLLKEWVDESYEAIAPVKVKTATKKAPPKRKAKR